MPIKIKRVYEEADPSDGLRILVDRLWPRGVSKEKIKIDRWLKEVSPSRSLRQWYGHDPRKWTEFKKRYFNELNSSGETIERLSLLCKKRSVTLLFAARDEKHNNAAALKEYLHRAD